MSDFQNIPEELQARDQWLLWDSSADTPRRPHWRGDFGISWSDPGDWHTFEEAGAAAEERESWGIGFVMAADNDDHPTGVYGCLDLDGCLSGPESPKEWLPSLKHFLDADAYIERSPSGDGLHIPLVGQEAPDWWTDSHVSPDEHEGVEWLTNKFCTFTGDVLNEGHDGVAAVDPAGFLFEAYEQLNGEAPLLEGDGDAPEADFDGEWSQDDIEDMLEHIDAGCAYPKWRNIAFAVHDWDATATGKSVFERWSRRSSAWDEDSERYIDAIWSDSDQGSGVTVGTLVYHAKQAGWEPPRRGQQSAAREGQQRAEADGGAVETSQSGDGSHYQSLQERVASRILTPLDPPEDYDGETIDLQVATDRLANMLTDEYSFVRPRSDVRGWRDTLYVYDEDTGVYEPHGEFFIESETERLLGPVANNQRVEEVTRKVKRMSGVRPGELTADPHRLVVGNGIVDLHTGELSDHTPDEYHRTCIDIDYNPEASCDRIDAFFHEIVDDRDVETLYQLVAHCLYKEYLSEKAAMLLGDGQNGKSVFLALIEEFLGEYNVSRRSLQDFAENDFAANNLQGKLANLHPDMASETVRELGVFKQLTGRDTMVADVKYEKPIAFENHATLIFAANRMPQMEEDTHALWRRWIYVNFPYTFSERDPEAKDPTPKRKLMRELTADEQLQGLLARAVEELNRWWEEGVLFTNGSSPEEVREKMKRASEPVYDFAMTCLTEVEDDEEHVRKDRVRDCYREFAREEGLPSIPDNAFGERLLKLRDLSINSSQRRLGEANKPTRVYTGVKLSARGRQVLGLDESEEDEDVTDAEEKWRRVPRAVRDLATEDSPATKGMIVGRLTAEGSMGLNNVENAIQMAKDKGAIYHAGDGYRAE